MDRAVVGRGRSDSGQAVPLAAAVVAVLLMAVVALGRFANDVGDAARARTAADASALAGASDGASGAAALAAANGATIVSISIGPGTCQVTVRVGDATSSARASVNDIG